MTFRLGKEVGRSRRQAGRYATNRAEAAGLVRRAAGVATRRRAALARVWDDLMTLLQMVGCWARGECRGAPLKTILSALAAIVYLVNPFDLIPDFIPGLGLIDDAAVIAFVANSIRSDLDEFGRRYRGSSGR